MCTILDYELQVVFNWTCKDKICTLPFSMQAVYSIHLWVFDVVVKCAALVLKMCFLISLRESCGASLMTEQMIYGAHVYVPTKKD